MEALFRACVPPLATSEVPTGKEMVSVQRKVTTIARLEAQIRRELASPDANATRVGALRAELDVVRETPAEEFSSAAREAKKKSAEMDSIEKLSYGEKTSLVGDTVTSGLSRLFKMGKEAYAGGTPFTDYVRQSIVRGKELNKQRVKGLASRQTDGATTSRTAADSFLDDIELRQ